VGANTTGSNDFGRDEETGWCTQSNERPI